MRLSLGKRAKDTHDGSTEGIPERHEDGDEGVYSEPLNDEKVSSGSSSCETIIRATTTATIANGLMMTDGGKDNCTLKLNGKEDYGMLDHFRKMRPTNWSPPPIKSKCFLKTRGKASPMIHNRLADSRESVSSSTSSSSTLCSRRSSNSASVIEIDTTGSNYDTRKSSNVCKITVSPESIPLVHRLQVNSQQQLPVGSKRTSIMINGDHSLNHETTNDNKVTISVGGEDSACNPTVISINTDSPPKIQNSMENRTLVILDNYRSNIVVESNDDSRETVVNGNNCKVNSNNNTSVDHQHLFKLKDKSRVSSDIEQRRKKFLESSRGTSTSDDGITRVNNSSTKTINGEVELFSNRSTSLSKEALISKLLEDSLRKARENGEIIDESSGEAILKILKQSLLKTREYESSESTIEADRSFSRSSSSLNFEGNFPSGNLFLEENPYEVIKEPIYEEIPDEPPPLPLSPPPSDDFLKVHTYIIYL